MTPLVTCGVTKGVICQMVPEKDLRGVNMTEEMMKENSTLLQCCSGFCVDLLLKLSQDLSFDFR